MKPSSLRTICALAALLALVFAATSLAIKPKPGLFSTSGNEPDHKSVTFTYEDGKLISFFAAIDTCKQGQPALVQKGIKVKKSGSFHYDGKASSPLRDHFHVDIEGEFLSKKKAKGTVDREDCDPVDFKVKLGQAG